MHMSHAHVHVHVHVRIFHTSHAYSLTLLTHAPHSLRLPRQMAEGLHFGIVPYISRPALGVVSGMVGAGGNTGALLSIKYIVGAKNLDAGFIRLGVIIIIGSLSMLLIFFPGEGGIILPKSFPYNPQLIKAASDQKGSDELDFNKAKGSTGTAASVTQDV